MKIKSALSVLSLSALSVPVFAGTLTADLATIKTSILGDIGEAAAVGVALMVVALGWDVGMSLIKKFVKKGSK